MLLLSDVAVRRAVANAAAAASGSLGRCLDSRVQYSRHDGYSGELSVEVVSRPVIDGLRGGLTYPPDTPPDPLPTRPTTVRSQCAQTDGSNSKGQAVDNETSSSCL